MTSQELLQYAKDNYPLGTIYADVYHKDNYNMTKTVVGTFVYYDKPKPCITDGWGGFVYFDGRWANKSFGLDEALKIIYDD